MSKRKRGATGGTAGNRQYDKPFNKMGPSNRQVGGTVLSIPKQDPSELPENSSIPEHSVLLQVTKNSLFVRVPLHHIPASCVNFETTSTRFHLDTLRFARKRYFLEFTYPYGITVKAEEADATLELSVLTVTLPIATIPGEIVTKELSKVEEIREAKRIRKLPRSKRPRVMPAAAKDEPEEEPVTTATETSAETKQPKAQKVKAENAQKANKQAAAQRRAEARLAKHPERNKRGANVGDSVTTAKSKKAKGEGAAAASPAKDKAAKKKKDTNTQTNNNDTAGGKKQKKNKNNKETPQEAAPAAPAEGQGKLKRKRNQEEAEKEGGSTASPAAAEGKQKAASAETRQPKAKKAKAPQQQEEKKKKPAEKAASEDPVSVDKAKSIIEEINAKQDQARQEKVQKALERKEFFETKKKMKTEKKIQKKEKINKLAEQVKQKNTRAAQEKLPTKAPTKKRVAFKEPAKGK